MSQSITRRHQQYQQAFTQNLTAIHELHQLTIHQLLPQLTQSLQLSSLSSQLVNYYLNDKLNLFRFFYRHQFDNQLTLEALENSIRWRLNLNLDLLSSNSLEPIYLRNPLMFFHPQLNDRWGRTTAILNLKHLIRTEDGSLNGLKEFIAWNCELARRSIYESNREHSSNTHPSPPSSPTPSEIPTSLQISLIVDLKGASINNLEVELLPYLLHLVKDNFPDLLGAVFILNYGWMYAGMWQVVKRILSQSTLDRILFPSQSELLEYFDKSNLLQEHGGLIVHQYDPQTNQFINRFGKPTTSSLSDYDPNQLIHPSLSSHPSLESIHDLFFSTVNTPHHQLSHPSTPNRSGSLNHSHRRPSWLNMTNYHPSTSQISSSSISDALQRNKSKSSRQAWLNSSSSNPNFKLKLPIRTSDPQDEETSNASTVPLPLLTSAHSTASSSSSSLSEIAGRQIKGLSTDYSHQPQPHGDNQDDDHRKHTPIVRFKKRKRGYFCIKLLIKFGYFLRTLQMLFKLLSSKLFTPLHLHLFHHSSRRPHQPSSAQRSGGLDTQERYETLFDSCRSHNLLHRYQLSLHQLFCLLNFQRKKILSSLGCLFIFLFFFKKKKSLPS